jgi:2-polyprenyl-6-methoxyphenol hydroxylase-like FAD-dependent oxidoreductase
VTVLESDGDPPADADTDSLFALWDRRGAGQAKQSHMFLGLSSAEMARGAPEVIEFLEDGGALRFDDPTLFDADGTPAPIIGARRFAYEMALRRAIKRHSRIAIRSSSRIVGLTSRSGSPPQISGVKLADGEEVAAELIVDCAGRRSMAHKWLVEAGSREVREERQACGFTYLTRWYRLREGEAFPDIPPPASTRMSYMNVLACPADQGWLSITICVSEKDHFRAKLRDGQGFDRIVSAIPVASAFAKCASAATEPLPFGNIANQRRSLIDEEGPLARGYLLVGDSSMHTNPTMGRGTSLAFAQARHLATSLTNIDAASYDLVVAEENWAKAKLRVWFDSQVSADGIVADRFDKLAAGEPLLQPDEASRTRGALLAASREELAVAQAVRRMANLLITPAELMSKSLVQRAIKDRVGKDCAWPEYADPLPRAEFERLLAAPAR